MNIIIAVPFKDREQQTISLIKSLISSLEYANLKTTFRYKFFLIDDDSERACVSRIQQEVSSYPYFYVIKNKGQGPGAARNSINNYIEKEDYIVFTDNDCVVDKTWIYTILQYCCKYNPLVLQGNPCLFQKTTILGEWEEKLYHCLFGSYLQGAFTSMIDSRNLIVHRSIFLKYQGGLFSETLNLAAAESRILMKKLEKDKVSVYYSEDIIVYHEDPPSILSSCLQKYRHGYGRVELWGEEPPTSRYLLERYFYIPIEKEGLPPRYIIPTHLSFLYGYYYNSNNLSEFQKIIVMLKNDYPDISIFNVLEV